jgi:hypothetical protein
MLNTGPPELDFELSWRWACSIGDGGRGHATPRFEPYNTIPPHTQKL